MQHACDMTINDFFSHEGTGGTTVQTRVRRVGYHDCLVAENIACGRQALLGFQGNCHGAVIGQ